MSFPMNNMNLMNNFMNGQMSMGLNHFNLNSSQYDMSELSSSFNDHFNSSHPINNNSQVQSEEVGDEIEDIELLDLAEDQVLSDLSDVPEEKEPSQYRRTYEENDVVCQEADVLLQEVLDTQGDVDQDEDKAQLQHIDLVQRYLKFLTENNKEKVINYFNSKQWHKDLQKPQQQSPQIYTVHQTRTHPKIQVLPSQPSTRNYKVYIQKQNFTISTISLNLSLSQLKPLLKPPNQLKQILKQVLNYEDRIVKISRIVNTHIESLEDMVTNVAMFKYYRRIQGRDQHRLGNEFGFDLVVFRDYVLYACQNYEKKENKKEEKQEKQQKQEKQEEEIKQKGEMKMVEEKPIEDKFVREFLRQLRIILLYKKMLEQKEYDDIEAYLTKYKDQQLHSTLILILSNHITYLNTKPQTPKTSKLPLLLPLLQPLLQPQPPSNSSQSSTLSTLLHTSFKSQSLQYQTVQNIQSLNPVQMRCQEEYLVLLLKLFKDPNTKNGFIKRCMQVVKLPEGENWGKEEEQNEEYMGVTMKLRRIMLLFAAKLPKNMPLTYQLLQYFSSIGDQLTSTILQQQILAYYLPTPQSILKQFQFFLSYKLSPIFIDCYLHNQYIGRLEEFKVKECLEEKGEEKGEGQGEGKGEGLVEVLEEERVVCLGVMKEIRRAVVDKEYQMTGQSEAYRAYCAFVDKHGQVLGRHNYDDVMLILKNIYQKNLLVFTKQSQTGLAYQTALSQNHTKTPLIKNPHLSSTLLKSHYYLTLYNTTYPQISQLKDCLRKIPPLYRYNSIYWLGFSQVNKEYKLAEGILYSTYVKLLNQEVGAGYLGVLGVQGQGQGGNGQVYGGMYSTDLAIVVQIVLKIHSDNYQHEKFKYQIMLRAIDKLQQRHPFIYSNNSIANLNISQKSKQQLNQLSLTLKTTNQLLYCCTRNPIYKLDGLRSKIHQKLSQLYQPLLSHYPTPPSPPSPSSPILQQPQKTLYLHTKILQITLLLCQNKKKEVLPIIGDLLARYPGYLALLYYFLKVKYSVGYMDKKGIKEVIFGNFWKIFNEGNLRLIRIVVTNQYVLDEIEEILHGSLKVDAMRFLHKFSQTIAQLHHKLPPSNIDTFIYNLFKHFLNKTEVPEEQAHCSYRTVTQILVDRTENVTFDADYLHERVVKMKVILRNPYLAYAMFQCLEGKKVILPAVEDCPRVFQIVNLVLGRFKRDQFIDVFREKLYNDVKGWLQKKLSSCFQQHQIKKLTRKIDLIDKKSCFLNSKQQSWLKKIEEKLSIQQKRQIQQYNQMMEKQSKDPKKKQQQQKSSKHIARSFKRLKSRLEAIERILAEKQQKKGLNSSILS